MVATRIRFQKDYARAFADKLNSTHPARPDVNGGSRKKLCLSLFEHNGVDTRTASGYRLSARTWKAIRRG